MWVNWWYQGYDWRHPSYPGRLALSGLGLLMIGLVEILILDKWFGLPGAALWGVGGMLAGLIVMVTAFVLDRLRGRKTQGDSR